MRKLIQTSLLLAIIAIAGGWAGWKFDRHRASRPVAGSFHRSKVDGSGHSRGIVQVDLMRQIMAARTASTPASVAAERETVRRVPSQDHPLLRQPAPALELKDVLGTTWNLRQEVHAGPVVVVFYLGSTCMACMTHLTELDVAMSRFENRRACVLAVSDDAPETSLERACRFGGFHFPLLSDRTHAAALAYGVWNLDPQGDKDAGKARHGTFIIDRDGVVRWVHVGDRPFTDVDALLIELESWNDSK
jgi:mycoredoxin-dependent peroxiredoxin